MYYICLYTYSYLFISLDLSNSYIFPEILCIQKNLNNYKSLILYEHAFLIGLFNFSYYSLQ
ncbi:hypothetical protein PFAG_00874 [Plasmodium falciparum Santa Lucia]|uniref:Uncharacterized protein n=2 Tax=Plasmodium falciparum TaxID=5833 RepID=W7GAK3_PLAFA|nr:hypothetical protein PFNF135_01014 [Plasmodium falciparum NF135/5.C10]EUT90518.1 hypothetical protein PFAG_00874 [Plasmodium falciparum Santa Lucia]